ncbi:MAG: hypothetical protein FWE36_02785 [Erysipelotrichales bacterium]|nr:hypothetical protein [Erysipelotrichales bacterium]
MANKLIKTHFLCEYNLFFICYFFSSLVIILSYALISNIALSSFIDKILYAEELRNTFLVNYYNIILLMNGILIVLLVPNKYKNNYEILLLSHYRRGFIFSTKFILTLFIFIFYNLLIITFSTLIVQNSYLEIILSRFRESLVNILVFSLFLLIIAYFLNLILETIIISLLPLIILIATTLIYNDHELVTILNFMPLLYLQNEELIFNNDIAVILILIALFSVGSFYLYITKKL